MKYLVGTYSYNSGTVTKAATCTSTGIKTYTCTVCSTTKTETIATTGHSTYVTISNGSGTAHKRLCYNCSYSVIESHTQ